MRGYRRAKYTDLGNSGKVGGYVVGLDYSSPVATSIFPIGRVSKDAVDLTRGR